MADEAIRSRIAPTPSGFLHLGNLFNFILTWTVTRQHRGELTLRIDDMDSTRCRLEYIDDIFQLLEWFELDWDHGPKNTTDFLQNYSQRLRTELYRQQLQPLQEYSYGCDCSRTQIKEHSPLGIYFGHCRQLKKKSIPQQTALRLLVDQKDLFDQAGDFVIWRKDDLPAYQLVSVIEDQLAKTNLIIRGEDLMLSTRCQRYLAELLHFDNFLSCKIVHHPLMLDQAGKKLSKSQGSADLRSWRMGANPTEMKQKVIHLFCQFFHLPQVNTLQELQSLDLSSYLGSLNE